MKSIMKSIVKSIRHPSLPTKLTTSAADFPCNSAKSIGLWPGETKTFCQGTLQNQSQGSIPFAKVLPR